MIESSLKFGRQLDSDHIPLQHFFIVLEHVLRHGLKPKKVKNLSGRYSKERDFIIDISGTPWTKERVVGLVAED